MLQIINIIAPLFIIIFTSAILQKYYKIDDKWNEALNNFAFKIGLPALLFSALANTTFTLKSQLPIIITNTLFLLTSFALAILIGKILQLKKQMRLTLFICFAFSNVAYLGIPVISQVYGTQILPTTSLIIAIYLFWLFTIGISYLDYSQNKNKKDVAKKIITNVIKNPLLLAVIFGIFAGSQNISIPTAIQSSLNMISASVTPIVLVVIGLFIGTSKIGKLSNWIPVLFFSLFTLLALPASLYLTIKILGINPSNFAPSIIEAAMPLAITPFALSDKYNLNKPFIARSIVASTILAIITIPFWVSIIN